MDLYFSGMDVRSLVSVSEKDRREIQAAVLVHAAHFSIVGSRLIPITVVVLVVKWFRTPSYSSRGVCSDDVLFFAPHTPVGTSAHPCS